MGDHRFCKKHGRFGMSTMKSVSWLHFSGLPGLQESESVHHISPYSNGLSSYRILPFKWIIIPMDYHSNGLSFQWIIIPMDIMLFVAFVLWVSPYFQTNPDHPIWLAKSQPASKASVACGSHGTLKTCKPWIGSAAM